MGGSPLKHLEMFQNLCGTEALKNVVLVTTMWDKVGEEEGNNRENELTANYWKAMIDMGCHTSRFYNNTKSALDIVSQFQDARCTVLLQKEMVDLHIKLAETSAGRTLFSSLVELIKLKKLLALIEAKLKRNQRSANRIADELEQDRAKTVRTLRIANVQRRRYSVSQIKRFTGRSSAVGTLRATTSGPLTSSPVECFPPPPSPAYATSQIRTHMVLQGTITALKLVQQIVGLAPVPGLQSLVVRVVLAISELVNVSFDTIRTK